MDGWKRYETLVWMKIFCLVFAEMKVALLIKHYSVSVNGPQYQILLYTEQISEFLIGQ